jgi:imidazolonepropionase-like amidohydrolase
MRSRHVLPLLMLAVGCAEADGGAVAYVGATLIDGTGAPPTQNAVMVIEDGRVSAVGPATEVEIPRGATQVDLSSRYVMPGMVNAHGHVGDTRGLESGHFSAANVVDQLGLYARYGVTTVVSLGGDQEASVRLRDAQAVATLDRARLFVAGAVVTGDTPEAAVAVAEANAELGVDFIKFRVDDNLGTTQKMPPEAYRAVIARADALGIPVATHVYYLDDAKALVRSGIDFVAHSVRDRPVDDELVSMLRESSVCYSPTLMREVSTFVYESKPAFFEDPFFLAEADSGVMAALEDPARQESVRQSRAAQLYKTALEQAKRNLATLADGGVRIAMGTDTGPPARFQGYFEQLELQMMAEAGMSNAAVIRAATGDAAACMGLEGVGTLEVGSWADFIVLAADPLEDITNSRSVEEVYVAGNRVPRGEAGN